MIMTKNIEEFLSFIWREQKTFEERIMKRIIEFAAISLLLLFFTGNAWAAPYKWVYLTGAHHLWADGSSSGYRLEAGVDTFNPSNVTPPAEAYVDLGDGIGDRAIPWDFQWHDTTSYIEEYWQHFDSLNPLSYNGNTVTFTHEADVFTSTVPADAFFQLPQTTNVLLSGDLLNPTLSWTNTYVNNTDLVNQHGGLTRYEVRVYDPDTGQRLWRERLYNDLDQVNQSLDFNTIAFNFDLNDQYIVRVETRLHKELIPTTGSAEWAGIINRDTVNIFYDTTVPVPGSILLLASGLLGILGFKRKR